MYITVKDAKEAWNEVNRIFPYDYQKDEQDSNKAGYSVYRATADTHYNNWISDLGTRLEVNTEDGKSVNIYIEPDEPQAEHNNSSYVFYITSSANAAHLISRGLREATPWTKKVVSQFQLVADVFTKIVEYLQCIMAVISFMLISNIEMVKIGLFLNTA